MVNKPLRLEGKRFDRLVVLEQAEDGLLLGSGRTYKRWVAKCDCGGTTIVSTSHLRSGATTSCGCKRKENTIAPSTTHGMSRGDKRSAGYGIWLAMRNRCNNKNDPRYKDYGGRGIKICPRWDSFPAFLSDMGERPSSKHSLDRIDNDGNYEPGNCRWATMAEQRVNQRPRKRIDQFTDDQLIQELVRRGYSEAQPYIPPGYPNPLRVPQHH